MNNSCYAVIDTRSDAISLIAARELNFVDECENNFKCVSLRAFSHFMGCCRVRLLS